MNNNWQYPTSLSRLVPTHVHVWRIPITNLMTMALPFSSILNHSEQKHSQSYQNNADRECYQITRFILRCLLGIYLKLPAKKLHFTQNEHGKPILKSNSFCTDMLAFNISHTHQYSVIAIGHHPVGIDIEDAQRNIDDPLSLAKRFFHPDEYQALSILPTMQHHAAFIHTWVCKEAWVKAHGTGLTHDLTNFVVNVNPQQPPSILTATDNSATAWHYWSLPPIPHHAGALVTRANVSKVNFYEIEGLLSTRMSKNITL